MKMIRMLLGMGVLVFAGLAVLAQVNARLIQEPAVSATQVAFIYGGDVWIAPKEGGLAQRLTTAAGDEQYPRFSPDGKRLAFTGNYDGNVDVYVMPSEGGMPLRITHDPMPDRSLGWYPDGKSLLVASMMESPSYRYFQLYKVSAEGGLPEKLPLPYGEFGAVSPDGKTLAFCPNAQDLRTWKRYRGGWVSRIVLFDLATRASTRVGDDGANYSQPMWHGGTLYFVSDRDANKRYNIWAFDPKTGAMRQLTFFDTFDVHFPSAGPDDLVFEAGGRLYLMDFATEKAREVKFQVVTDEASLRPKTAKVGDEAAGGSLSPGAKRVFFEARGDVFSVPAEHGPTFDMTRTSGVAERYGALSRDGKTLAYWSDRTGNYELALRNADGTGEERTVTHLGPGYRYRIFWSPDSKRVAFADQTMAIRLCDLATGAVTQVDQGLWLYHDVQDNGHESLTGFTVTWSPDSRYAAWSREAGNRMGAIFLYDTQTRKTSQLTSGFYYDASPAFDPSGAYLFYLTRRTFRPVYSDLDATWIYANGTQISAVPLRADGASPVAPRNDAEGMESEKRGSSEPGKEGDVNSGKEAAKKGEPVTIDVAGFEGRAVLLPPKPGNYADLGAVEGKVLYRRLPTEGAPEDAATPLGYYDLKEREEKTILPDVSSYALAPGGEKLLARYKNDWAIVEVKADQKMDKKLDLSGMEMTVDPRAEWTQIFTDAWRFERDFFYDPAMHGENWDEMRSRYGALIAQCASRSDVNYVIGELIGEINSSHTYRGGGDLDKPAERSAGLLGCDFALANGAYRIANILHGAPWDISPRSPLDEPGAGVKVGDWLLAVNGVPLDTKEDPWAAFQGLAGKTVTLTVNDKPTAAGARTVLVKTLSPEEDQQLRNIAWVEANREKVDKASGGRLGYIYVPDTGTDGQNELYRQFMAQFTKEGLVIDERFNSGGQIPDRFIELLDRPITNYWRVRDGRDWQWPEYANGGPKVMLINGWSGSGGDCFPYYFREAKLGPLVGQRTWGGLIGISGSPEFVDGGIVTVPTFGFYTPEGKWAVEGHGVEPDIPVADDFTAMAKGDDPQLDRAIQEAMCLLQEHPPVKPARPAYENRAGK